jgi:hypothetical protein
MRSSGTDQGGRRKIVVALLVIGVFGAGMIGLQLFAENFLSGNTEDTPVVITPGNQNFSWVDFRYGPQAWRPYNRPLAIGSGETWSDNETWYILFTQLNGTPYGGNPDLRRTGSVQVHYRFSGLAGTAAFHIYGLREDSDQYFTSRQDGWGRSAYTVTGNEGQGIRTIDTLPFPASNHLFITTSDHMTANSQGLSDGTYYLRFDKGGDSGLDALHIVADPGIRKGRVIKTTDQEGTFYITHNGGSTVKAVLLMVAVDTMEPDSFGLNITSEFVGSA